MKLIYAPFDAYGADALKKARAQSMQILSSVALSHLLWTLSTNFTSRFPYAIASAGTRFAAPEIVATKISHCGDGSLCAYSIIVSIALSLNSVKLWDFQ